MNGVWWLLCIALLGFYSTVVKSESKWNIKYSEDGKIVLLSGDSKIQQYFIKGLDGENAKTTDCSSGNDYSFCTEWKTGRVQVMLGYSCSTSISESKNPVDVGPGIIITSQTNFTGHLYGGPEQAHQYWPLDNVTFKEYAYITKAEDNQAIAERYWLTTNGMFYYIGPTAPMFLQMNIQNNGSLEFINENKPPYPSPRPLIINQTVCEFDNAKVAHMYAVENYLGKPKDIPRERMIRYPIWSTWARYKTDIDQDKVLAFATQIRERGFKNSHIEIDDKWETCYGSLTFDQTKFPNMTKLKETFQALGIIMTLWIHPFINTDCSPYYEEAIEKGYFVKNAEGSTRTKWWNGEAGIIDFTNPVAVTWWTNRLKRMMADNGITSLKFDAGETSWLPQVPVLTGNLTLQPHIYTRKYVETAVAFGDMIEIRVGFQTQEHPVFVRMVDKDSRWGFDNGLPTLVTTLFQMNLAGYPFVLPDMVGGNGYSPGGRPSKELFIRWLQANVFMPAIQYSYVPWDYDDETTAICKKYTELHEKYADKIIEAMKNATKYGTPVNPPIWWLDPKDEVAQVINDEYLLGEVLLVAPVIKKGAVSRDIYLPIGSWQDKLRGTTIEGPTWLKNYTVALGELAYFELVTESGATAQRAIQIICLIACILVTHSIFR